MNKNAAYKVPVYSIKLVKENGLSVSELTVTQPQIAAKIASNFIGFTDREHFIVLLLDTRGHIIGINTVSIGTLDGSLVHPREVFKPAILSNAHSIILAHNHPGGNPSPSREDKAVTQTLVQAGKLLDIQVKDHLIVTLEAENFYSMADHAEM